MHYYPFDCNHLCEAELGLSCFTALFLTLEEVAKIKKKKIKKMEKPIDQKILSLLQCAFNNNSGPPPLHG